MPGAWMPERWATLSPTNPPPAHHHPILGLALAMYSGGPRAAAPCSTAAPFRPARHCRDSHSLKHPRPASHTASPPAPTLGSTRNHSMFSRRAVTVLTLSRCCGPTLVDTLVEPQVPQPSVSEGSR